MWNDLEELRHVADDTRNRVTVIEKLVRQLQEQRYLPMDCPNCGRHRLEYDGQHITCEKCGSKDWEHPDNR